LLSFIPARCWIAPEIPRDRQRLHALVRVDEDRGVRTDRERRAQRFLSLLIGRYIDVWEYPGGRIEIPADASALSAVWQR
jgi:hypothetical protein